jgi:hypothetical protein
MAKLRSVDAPQKAGGLRALLLPDHHDRLQLLLEELLLEEPRAYGPTGQQLWLRFREEFQAHVTAEERWLLPPFLRAEPAEGALLRAEHRELARRVAELDQAFGLHASTAQKTLQLMQLLRAHDRREEQGLYAWSVEHLEELPWAEVREWMRETMGLLRPAA